MLSDSRYVLQIKYDQQNEIVASFSNEEHSVTIQEILFEKYWNEVNTLTGINNNQKDYRLRNPRSTLQGQNLFAKQVSLDSVDLSTGSRMNRSI